LFLHKNCGRLFFFHDFQQRVKLKENCQPGKAEWERRLFDGKVAGGVVAWWHFNLPHP